MAEKLLVPALPADLPENMEYGQIIAPTGSEIGMPAQYGYNYLLQQVNAAQRAYNSLSQFTESLTAEQIEYLNAAMPDVSHVGGALTTLNSQLSGFRFIHGFATLGLGDNPTWEAISTAIPSLSTLKQTVYVGSGYTNIEIPDKEGLLEIYKEDSSRLVSWFHAEDEEGAAETWKSVFLNGVFSGWDTIATGAQLSNKVNENIFLTSSLGLYVSATGSDTAGDGTQGKPFLTIQRAVNEAVRYVVLKGIIDINIGSGTFAESVLVPSNASSLIRLAGAGSSLTTLVADNSKDYALWLGGNTHIEVESLSIKIPGGVNRNCIYMGGFTNLTVHGDVVFDGGGTGHGVYVSHGRVMLGRDTVDNPVKFNNLYIAVYAYAKSDIKATNLAGSGNTIGFMSGRSSSIIHSNTTMTAATLENKSAGGIIFRDGVLV